MQKGTTTALITPFKKRKIDYEAIKKLVAFQNEGNVDGILALGTTAESPTIKEREQEKIMEEIYNNAKTEVIAGTGSNSTEKTIKKTKFAKEIGINSCLLVEPYYNGPSSLEIRKEYVEVLAEKFSEMQFIPYVIPGRTGTQLLPQDLAIAFSKFKNVNAVKEATGNIENMGLTRKLCGEKFAILSGDDDRTYEIMTNEKINASGVISVATNVFPYEVSEMVNAILNKEIEKAKKLAEKLSPIFKIITVKTEEETPFGKTTCKARNPLAIKTLMNILGMPAGNCRKPLGKMTKNGFNVVLSTAKEMQTKNPEIFERIENFFAVKVEQRLGKDWKELYYDNY